MWRIRTTLSHEIYLWQAKMLGNRLEQLFITVNCCFKQYSHHNATEKFIWHTRTHVTRCKGLVCLRIFPAVPALYSSVQMLLFHICFKQWCFPLLLVNAGMEEPYAHNTRYHLQCPFVLSLLFCTPLAS